MHRLFTSYSATKPVALRPGRLRRHLFGRLLALVWFAGTLVCAQADEPGDWSAAPYRLGHGLVFPRQRLTVGGYLSLFYNDLDGRGWSAGVRDLSLFLGYTPSPRWSLFSELELGNPVEFSSHGPTDSNAELDLERLYADYRATRTVNLRVGKFLTPVGRWNLIHADPLVWTVDRPLTTSAPFARHATGAMLYGNIDTGGKSLDYDLFVDDSDHLDPSQKKEQAFEDDGSDLITRNAFERAAGGSFTAHFLDDQVQLGASYVRMSMADLPGRMDLFGVDALWNVGRTELTGEYVYRNSTGSSERDEYGGFVQAAVPIAARLHAIARYERFRASQLPRTSQLGVLGLTYRPHEAVSIKLEYREGEHNHTIAPDGWLAGVAVLF